MRALKQIIKRLLVRYFDFLPVPSSFRKIDKNTILPIVITQSNSIIIEALLTSFAKRSGCEFSNFQHEVFRDNAQSLPQENLLHAVNIHSDRGIEFLLESKNLENRYFSTLNIFRGKGPIRNHPSYKMKLLDFFALLLGPPLQCKFLLIVFGEPIRFPHFEHPSAHKLRRRFKLDFYANLKLVRGTPFQRFSLQEKIVLGGKDYEKTITRLSKSMKIPASRLHRQAQKTFRKIAARPRAVFYIPAAIIARFVLRRLFTDVQVKGLSALANSLKKDTVVIIPMHRSHLDYILIGSILYEANLNPPLTAAGINLSFWPAGPMIRTLGGYFVKRSARHDRIYGLVLKRYVHYLVKRGHLQEFFIEGGRSRSGRMRSPKLGLLKTMVNTYLRKDRRDLVFIPVSISYEHVVEDTEYAKENSGVGKTKESLFSLFRARGMLRQKYKEVIVNFGEPIRLSDFKREHDAKSEKSFLVEELGYDIIRKIEGYSNLGLRSLTCLSLFLSPNYGMRRRELSRCVKNLAEIANWYREMEGNTQFALPTSALKRFLKTNHEEHTDFHASDVISRSSYLGDELIYIKGSTRYTAEFYKNSIFHLFVPLGFLSIMASLNRGITPKAIRPWYDLFQHELHLPKWPTYSLKIQRFIDILFREKILFKSEDNNYYFTEHGQQYNIPGLLFPLIESMLWISKCLENCSYVERPHPLDPSHIRRVYEYTNVIKTAQQQLKNAKYLSEFTRTEASSLSSITSSLDSMASRGLVSFQERFGKRSTLTLEHPLDAQKEILLQTHKALKSAIQSYPALSQSSSEKKHSPKAQAIQ